MQQDFGKWLYNVGLKRVQSAEWRRCFTPVEVQKIIDSYVGAKKYFPMGLKEKSITHNDTFPGNYLFDTDRNLTGAIDFGRVMIAHPLLELVVVLNNRFRFYSQKSKDVFLKGYTNHCHPEFISGSKGISDLLTPEFLQAHVILSATQAIMTGTANGDQRYVDESIQWLREKVLS
ncbi:MAG: aminoglycoside phosphotransferase family protein [Patescibacteria group bacterium]|nr:aminoglycoside phosphotransferase family protein [Patescibacteria group bacterium]